MKNLTNMNARSFIAGLVIGGVAIFTGAAASHRPAVWDYKVVEQDIKYNTAAFCTDALNQSATNGWEFVSAQIIPNGPGGVFDGAKVMIIQKQSKR